MASTFSFPVCSSLPWPSSCSCSLQTLGRKSPWVSTGSELGWEGPALRVAVWALGAEMSRAHSMHPSPGWLPDTTARCAGWPGPLEIPQAPLILKRGWGCPGKNQFFPEGPVPSPLLPPHPTPWWQPAGIHCGRDTV